MPPPNRWEVYTALGSVIPGTKFIAFKVPLKQELSKILPEKESFSPDQLVQSVRESGKRLGLVVDLTFTRKYYNEKDFTRHAIQYEKIFTEGHQIPSDDVFHRFWQVVNEFSVKNTDEDILIGVHCTHGINRTGYLVCRYMIEWLNIDPDEAIAMFGEARGHPIERENYITDLKSRGKTSDDLSASGSFSRHSRGSTEQQFHSQRGPAKSPWNGTLPNHYLQSPFYPAGNNRGGFDRNRYSHPMSGYWNQGHSFNRSDGWNSSYGRKYSQQNQGYWREQSHRSQHDASNYRDRYDAHFPADDGDRGACNKALRRFPSQEKRFCNFRADPYRADRHTNWRQKIPDRNTTEPLDFAWTRGTQKYPTGSICKR